MNLDFFHRLAAGRANDKGSIRPRPKNPFESAPPTSVKDEYTLPSQQPEAPTPVSLKHSLPDRSPSFQLPTAPPNGKSTTTAGYVPAQEIDKTAAPTLNISHPNNTLSQQPLPAAKQITAAASQEQAPLFSRQEPIPPPMAPVQPSAPYQARKNLQTIVAAPQQAVSARQEIEGTETASSPLSRKQHLKQPETDENSSTHRVISTIAPAPVSPAKGQKNAVKATSTGDALQPREEQQPTIEISIGRIILQPEPRSKSAQEVHHRFQPALTLDSYLEQRNRGTG